MAEIVKELTLEVYSANRIKAIVAKQYDYKSRYLLIRLTDGGKDISIDVSSVVTVNAFRPNGESAAFLGSAEQDGRILVPLTYWMLELEGTVKCDVSVVDTDERKLSSTNFQIEVERANYSGDDIEQDEHYDLLVELLAEVAKSQEAENARVAAESARVTAENNRVSEETARQTAETARASAETARDTAEGARSSAETARGTAETARASAETTRQANEASRVSAEAARAAAETAREEAEEEREHALDDYAKKDGVYEGLTAGLAENLTPLHEDSGIEQTQPFFLEGTGCGNGESVADVGAYLQLKEKRGNMVCVNQYLNGVQPTTTLPLSVNGNRIEMDIYSDGAGLNKSIMEFQNIIPAGDIVLVMCNKLSGTATGSISIGGYHSGASTSWQGIVDISTPVGTISNGWHTTIFTTTDTVTDFWLFFYSGFSVTEKLILDCYYVDLTQWFNGNIPAYLLSHPEAFGRYYKGSLTYEPGRLEPATGRYFESVERNLFDKSTFVKGRTDNGVIGYAGDTTSMTITDTGVTFVTAKAYRGVVSGLHDCAPNTYYYLNVVGISANVCSAYIDFYDVSGNWLSRTAGQIASTSFVTPVNAYYYRLSFQVAFAGTFNLTNITISIYYTGESGYDQYYPHKVLATIDTGTEQLGAFDYKVPSGLITRLTGSVDLGTLDWVSAAGETSKFYSGDFNIKVSGKAICSRYTQSQNQWYTMGSGNLWVNNSTVNHNVWIRDDAYTDAASFKAAMAGVILYYELAEPTTEQGTPYQESVPIDDFGQLSWSDTDVPQGNQIFYPVDYKAAVDTLINYTDGDITGLAKRGSLTDTDPQTLKALVDYVNGKIPAAPTTDGTYDLVCTVTNGEPTFSWVART